MIRKLLYLQCLFKNVKTNVVKYFQESEFTKETCQATEGSAGYDLYVAETRTIMPNSADCVSI